MEFGLTVIQKRAAAFVPGHAFAKRDLARRHARGEGFKLFERFLKGKLFDGAFRFSPGFDMRDLLQVKEDRFSSSVK